jgi:DNA-binding NarL/FixJ family response regulator
MMKLLLVDDSLLIRSRLIQLLSPIEGVGAIATATSLYETWVLVKTFKPDLMVLDMYLTDGHAANLVSNFRNVSPKTRIAVLSNDATDLTRMQCASAGVDWYFDKSREFESLVQVVRQEAKPQRQREAL